MKKTRAVFSMSAVLGFLGIAGCTDYEDGASAVRTWSQDDPESIDSAETTPKRQDDPAPSTTQTADEDIYATHILIEGGCMAEPFEIAVPKEHAFMTKCERIKATAYQQNDALTLGIKTPLMWSVADSTVIELWFAFGQSSNIVVPFGLQDIFDVGGLHEPSTEVTICVENACPDPAPSDCKPKICTKTLVVSVINLEGEWSFSGPGLDPENMIEIFQDGRTFTDQTEEMPDGTIQNGVIIGTQVSFLIGSLGYSGEIQSDRSSMSGTAVDGKTDETVGAWSAVRL